MVYIKQHFYLLNCLSNDNESIFLNAVKFILLPNPKARIFSRVVEINFLVNRFVTEIALEGEAFLKRLIRVHSKIIIIYTNLKWN